MIPIYQAVVLGIVQGLAEFLPISSSAHLVIVPALFHWRDPGLSFDVALHLGTLLALLVYFFRDWLAIIKSGLGFRSAAPPNRRLLWLIVAATIPGAIAGALLEKEAEGAFRSLPLIALTLSLGGLLLLFADRWGKNSRQVEDFNLKDALLAGLAQAAAIVPGISRSGATIAAARALGYGRKESARLSFLLATPITAGAAILGLRHLGRADLDPAFFSGVIAAAVVGFIVIKFLLKLLERTSFLPFVIYRFLISALIILAVLFR